MKNGHSRKPIFVKTYLAVFVCFSTKASPPTSRWSQTSPLRRSCRFVSRRGLPEEIHSDKWEQLPWRQEQPDRPVPAPPVRDYKVFHQLLLAGPTSAMALHPRAGIASQGGYHTLAPSGKLQLNLPSAIFDALSAPRDWTSRSSQQWQLKSRPASIADPS